MKRSTGLIHQAPPVEPSDPHYRHSASEVNRMYYYRKLTPEQQYEVAEYRRLQRRPCHSPPHWDFESEMQVFISDQAEADSVVKPVLEMRFGKIRYGVTVPDFLFEGTQTKALAPDETAIGERVKSWKKPSRPSNQRVGNVLQTRIRWAIRR